MVCILHELQRVAPSTDKLREFLSLLVGECVDFINKDGPATQLSFIAEHNPELDVKDAFLDFLGANDE